MLGDRRWWIIVLTVCALVGAVANARLLRFEIPTVNDPDVSLRVIATQHLGSSGSLEELRVAITSLPREGDVLFFGSAYDWSTNEIFLLTSYLGWPRQVWFMDTGGSPTRPPGETPPSGLFFFGVQPPDALATEAQRIGNKLTIVTKLDATQP